ncbi:glutamine-dependent NAD(+) synthetase [mine drainage metagenome]|uniref:NAD(+) synthase (glutamine-hydrolyzing) n=1 Tax=mine drainage metagenome TaxID=410659 RepID=A0A1J5QP76_9ZZZZ
MKVAIAQINCTVGDLAGNADLIIDYAQRARLAGAVLLLTPELALSGYPPEDLLLRTDFYHASDAELRRLAKALPDITVVVGHPAQKDGEHFNAASILQHGEVVATYHKQCLPNYSVFDEVRYFVPGDQPLVFELQGVRFGVVICADVWEAGPAALARDAGAEVLLALNASPYHLEKQATRYEVLRERVAETGLPVIYANLVGGQDELVFDGASFVLDGAGILTHQFAAFDETLGLLELDGARPLPGAVAEDPGLEAAVYRALCLGVRDYVRKNGFPGVLLGLSGGIDSALTLALAVDALGASQVRAVMMPSQFTADISLTDAAQMAGNMGVAYTELAIEPVYDSFMHILAGEFAGRPFDLTEENLQARIRGTLLMALSNKFGAIVLTTGNKSEMAVGYSTLYGDMAGGFAVLKDVPKTLVYRLSRYRNGVDPVIPERIMTRPPTAELRHGQQDQDTLPPYEILDGILQAYVEDDCSPAEIVALGYAVEDVRHVVALIDRNEYKRRQSPVGVRITQRGFGKDRRYPITSKFSFAI